MLENFLQAQQHGFSNVQLVSWSPELWTQEEADKIGAMLKQTGITVTAFWCGWEGPKVWDFRQGPETLGIVPQAYRWARVKNLLAGAEFAGKLGLSDIVTHAGYIPESPSDNNYAGVISALHHVASEYLKQGFNLLFETGQETPVTLLRCIQDVGLPNLYINLDPANLIMYGKANPVDALDVFGSLVRGVHAKDGLYPTDGHFLGKEVKVGDGKVDFPALLQKLKSLGYNGSLTIEREISGPQQIEDILQTKIYLSRLIQSLS